MINNPRKLFIKKMLAVLCSSSSLLFLGFRKHRFLQGWNPPPPPPPPLPFWVPLFLKQILKSSPLFLTDIKIGACKLYKTV